MAQEAAKPNVRGGEGKPQALQNGVVAVLATVIDVDGRSVELTEERWAHIVGAEPHRAGQPELSRHLEAVLRPVQAPDHRRAGRRDGEEWFYVAGAGPSRFLKVVASQTLSRELDVGVVFRDAADLAAQLRDRDRMDRLRENVWRRRAAFTFDAHVDFLRSVVARAGR